MANQIVDVNFHIDRYSDEERRALVRELYCIDRSIACNIYPNRLVVAGSEVFFEDQTGGRGLLYGRACRYAISGQRTILLSYFGDNRGSYHIFNNFTLPLLHVHRVLPEEVDNLFNLTSGYSVIAISRYALFCEMTPAPPCFRIVNQLIRIQQRPNVRLLLECR